MQQRIVSQKMMQQSHNAIVRIVVTVAGSLLILLPLLVLLNLGASPADAAAPVAPTESVASANNPSAALSAAAPNAASADCAGTTSVPVIECAALVELYTKTSGDSWITHTHWLEFGPIAPCGWYGVTCVAGHVRNLLLPGNALSGTLPLSLGDLTDLRRLRLENNILVGRIPPTICNLTKLTELNLAYNALFTLRQGVENCLATLDSDWQATQTNAPTDLRLTEITTDSLRFNWKPIAYTADGGYYEIGIADKLDGPYTLQGHTLSKISSAYVITGLTSGHTYFVRVRSYTPAHGDQPNDVRSLAAQGVGVTRAASGRVLLAAFFPADNDLAPQIPYVVERMRRGTSVNPNVQIALLVDGNQNNDTRLLEIANGAVVTTNVVMDQWHVNELDTADPNVLSWFLNYARATFPADKTVAAIIGHGIAQAPEIDWPVLSNDSERSASNLVRAANSQIPILPKEHEYSPSDVTNRSYMSAVDVGKALMDATGNGAHPFDVILFDQCFQGNLDVLYEVRNSAKIYVASPNYAWLVAAYDRYLTFFTPTSTPEEMAQAIIDNYEAALNVSNPNAIFWIANSDLLAIAVQVSVLADALNAALQDNQAAKIATAALDGQYVDTTQCGYTTFDLRPPDELIGIETFGGRLAAAFGTGDPYGVSTALTTLQTLISHLGKRHISGHPYIAPTQFWDYFNSLTILAPLPRETPPDIAWRASIYSTDTPFTATWSADPSEPVTVTESLAYARDGHWANFLKNWYLKLKPTVGQWCQYIPPAQVVVTETEGLSLTANAVTTDSMQLVWTPTDDASAVEYWLYAQGPFDIGWHLNRTIPLSQSSINLINLDAGSHRYRIVANDQDAEAIVESNELSVTLAGAASSSPTLLLPLLLHQ